MKPNIDIRFDSQDGQYFGGAVIRGRILVQAPQTIPISTIQCRLHGEMHTEWVNKVSDRIYDSLFTLIDDVQDLSGYLRQCAGDGHSLPQGNHSIPFTFSLAPDLPSSIFNEYCGWVTYSVQVKVSLPPDMQCMPLLRGTSEFEHSQPITVITFLNLRNFPNVQQPASRSNSIELTSCFGSQGMIAASISLDRSGFVAGEVLNAGIEILNKSKKKKLKKTAVLVLEQLRRYIAENRYERGAFDEKSLNYNMGTVDLPPLANTENFKERISIRIPPDALPTSLNSGQSENEKLISIAYVLRLDLELFEVSLPVIIGNFSE